MNSHTETRLMVITIARYFAELLAAQMPTDEWDEMRRDNAKQLDAVFCHSHNYLDANMVMAEAYEMVTGEEFDASTEDQRRYANEAWDFAFVHWLSAPARPLKVTMIGNVIEIEGTPRFMIKDQALVVDCSRGNDGQIIRHSSRILNVRRLMDQEDAPRMIALMALNLAMMEADTVWGEVLCKTFGKRAGDVRYTRLGRGNPGTDLNRAYRWRTAAFDEWMAVRG